MVRIDIPYNPNFTVHDLYSMIQPKFSHPFGIKNINIPLGQGEAILISSDTFKGSRIRIVHNKKKQTTIIEVVRAHSGSTKASITAVFLLLLAIIPGLIIIDLLSRGGPYKEIVRIVEELVNENLIGSG